MTPGPTDLPQAGILIAATAAQLAIVVAAYFIGRTRAREVWPRPSEVADSPEELPESPDQAAARMKTLFRFAPDALLLCHPNGIVIDVNEYTTELSGYSRAELLDRSLAELELIDPADRDKAATEFAGLANRREGMHAVELTIRRKNGTRTPVEIRGDLIPWQDGVSVLISARNISEHKKAQARIREQQARLTLLFEQLPAHVWSTDKDLRIVSASGRGLEALRVTEAQLVGRPLLDVLAGSHIIERTRHVHGRALNGEISRFAARLAGNEIEGAVGPLRDEAGNVEGVIGIALNVTEEAHARRRLHEREALLEQAQAMADMGSWEWDLAHGTIHWSADIFRLLGVEPTPDLPVDAPAQMLIDSYLSMVVEEDRDRIRLSVASALQAALPYRIEHRVRRPDGSQRWLVSSAQIEINGDGKPRRLYGFVQDITAQKAAAEEVLQLNAELEQRVSERTRQLEAAIEDLRSFNYAVSHDLRQPLRSVSGFLTLIEEEAGAALEGESLAHLARVKAAAHRMDALIDSLLALSRVTNAPLSRTRFDLSALATEVARDVAGGDGSRTAEWVIQPGLVVEADRGLMRLVLENLFGNAWKFTRGRDLARIEFGEDPGACHASAPAADEPARPAETCFFVRDNGAGFDPSQAPRLFQPFQRLHDAAEFEGTGIGLATVGRIIRSHGGQIRAEGRRGAGATFRFSLPSADSAPPA